MFGTRPVPPAEALRRLRDLQSQVVAANRFGIPAVAHEECLTGFAAWTATIFPTPLAWGASFDPGLVGEMAAAIGASMRAVGVHQGLSPVLDVTRDPRWGRTEETIGEDPYLVGSVGTAYVRGLQSAGIQATLKHFAGYSASRAGRNMAPVAIGGREFADVILVPFEMALRGGARSVMPSYTDIDGVPVSGDRALLTGLLRDELGFDGVVVSDYYAIAFLQTQHAVAATPAQAAALALEAGLDVELPSVACYGAALAGAVRDGLVAGEFVDRAAARVLRQKCDLGLLDPGWPGLEAAPANGANGEVLDLDPPGHRALARRLAEESVVLLANRDAALPLQPNARIAVTGPLADDPLAFYGCYSMPRHLGGRYPEAAEGPPSATVLAALRAELPGARDRLRPRLRRARGGPLRVRARRRARAGGGRGGGRARRRGGPVRPRHLGRGLRRGRPAAARRAGRPAADHGRLGHPGGAGAGHRAAVRDRPGGRAAGRGWCRRSSRARRAAAPSPGCYPGGWCPAGGCRSRCPPRREGSRPRTCARGWPPGTRAARWTRRRCSPSATACPTPASPTPTWSSTSRRSARTARR